MRNWISLLLLLALLLGSPASLPASAEPARPAAANPRFVVFEGFYSLT